MILRVRALLGRIYEGQGLILESFYIQRQGLQNFLALADGQFKDMETGAESETKGTFKLPDGTAVDAKGKGGKADPKQAKKPGNPTPSDED